MNNTRTGLCLTSTLTLLLASPALGQEPNPLGRFKFTQELSFSDNPDLEEDAPGSTLTARTGLEFDLIAETRVQRLALSLGTDLERQFGEAEEDFDFVNDRATLTYARDGKNSGVDLALSYRNTPFEDIEIGTETDPDALVIDGGRRETTALDFGFDTGRNARTAFALDVGWSRTDYVNTFDPSLLDSETIDVDAEASFALNEALTASLLAGVEETDEESDITRETSYVGVGLTGETRGGFTFSGDLTYDQAETVGGANPRDEDGLGLSLALTRDRPLGAYSLTLASRIDEAGRASSISLGREMELPSGALSWSVGVANYEDSDTGLTGSLSWSRDMKDSSFTASLSREQRPNDDVPYADTRIELIYSGELSELSRWSASLDYFNEDELGGDADGQRTSASVIYTRDLTPDWQLNTGYEYTRVDPISGDERDRNSVFVNIQRDVTFGF